MANEIDAPDRFLRIDTVLKRTGLKRATLYRKIQSGSFPKQVAISTRCSAWRETAIKRWMANPSFYSVDDDAPV
jgi:prophage regulatory protein